MKSALKQPSEALNVRRMASDAGSKAGSRQNRPPKTEQEKFAKRIAKYYNREFNGELELSSDSEGSDSNFSPWDIPRPWPWDLEESSHQGESNRENDDQQHDDTEGTAKVFDKDVAKDVETEVDADNDGNGDNDDETHGNRDDNEASKAPVAVQSEASAAAGATGSGGASTSDVGVQSRKMVSDDDMEMVDSMDDKVEDAAEYTAGPRASPPSAQLGRFW